jgi:hypothetical protein
MLVTNDKPTVYFDVDSTLVFTALEAPINLTAARVIYIRDRGFVVHEPHVAYIKDFAARGHNVIVWSQGGAEWSAVVVVALGLENYVTACLSKPAWYFDDKYAEEWLMPHQRSYIEA